MGNLACVTHGAAMVYPGEGFDPLVTCRPRAGEMHRALWRAHHVYRRTRSSPLRQFALAPSADRDHGGKPLPIEIMRKVVDRLHIRDLTICYGMTDEPGELPDRA